MALTFSMAWNPPTASVHSFTRASDYDAKKEAGCTNSGEGCHGDESEYRDFNDYHPNAECTTCHEYQGVGCIPCHAPREHECALCHDGSMKAAPDRVRITDPFPRGHYRETTHTATATDFDRRVRSAKDGEASAPCDSCHSRGLDAAHRGVPVVDGSPYGTDVGCGECHNDVRSFGQAEVLSDWEARSCEACHKVGSSSPLHAIDVADAVEATGTAGCADSGDGCHPLSDLHALHPNAPQDCSGFAADGEPTCHDLGVESHAPAARSCGGNEPEACHRSTDPSGYRHKDATDAHAPATRGPASDRSVAGTPCGACHYMAPDGRSLLTEHSLATSTGSARGASGCVNCHAHEASAEAVADEWAARDTDASCATCHDGSLLAARHGDAAGTGHIVESGSEGCADSGAGCHPGRDVSVVGEAPGALHRDCVRCHDKDRRDGNQSYSPGRLTCGAGRDCHRGASYDPETGFHGGSVKVDGDDINHTAAAIARDALLADEPSGTSTACSACHTATLLAEHTRPSTGLAGRTACVACHNANATTISVVKAGWPARETPASCAACHNGRATEAIHGAIATSHAATQKSREGTITAEYCSRVGCHGTADVRVLHAEKGCALPVCHSAEGEAFPTGIMTCGGVEGDERSCHAGPTKHGDFDASHVATEVAYDGSVGPGGCVRPGCHATADVTELHEDTPLSCYQAPCHGVDGPRRMTCGGNDPATACHTGTSKHQEFTTKHAATELDRHGEPTPGGCAKPGCHVSADVTVVHEHKCAIEACHVEGGPAGIMSCGGGDPAVACHVTRHPNRTAKHTAVERDPSGAPSPGYCVRSGCHGSVEATTVHEHQCYIAGCHVTGGPTVQTCGGSAEQTDTCHATYSDIEHHASHDASLTGTVAGVTYGVGENDGCLGTCHARDLVAEHRVRLLGGGLEGAATSVCSICHAVVDPGEYASATAVEASVAGKDRRCVSCHASDAGDGPTGVSAPPPSCSVAAPQVSVSLEPAATVTADGAAVPARHTKAQRRSLARETRARADKVRRKLESRRRRSRVEIDDAPRSENEPNAPPGSPPATDTADPPIEPAEFAVTHDRPHRRDPR